MKAERVRVASWSHEEAPTEGVVHSLLKREGLRESTWSRAAGHVSRFHTHEFDKVVYVLKGDVTYRLPASNRSIQLGAGDRLDLPAYVVHNTMAGPDGVLCIEGRRNDKL